MSAIDKPKDFTSAWVLDAGPYAIRLGNSSRSTHVVANVVIPSAVVTEQNARELGDQTPDEVWASDPANFYSYVSEAGETSSAPTVTVDTSAFTTIQAASPYQQDTAVDSSSPYYAIDGSTISSITAYVDPSQTDWEQAGAAYAPKTGETVDGVQTDPNATLFDVAKGDTTLEQFVAGLSVVQLANIVEGASAFGSTSHAWGRPATRPRATRIRGSRGSRWPTAPRGSVSRSSPRPRRPATSTQRRGRSEPCSPRPGTSTSSRRSARRPARKWLSSECRSGSLRV